MADMMGFDACGIEIDAALVATAHEVASRHRSAARFIVGSFLPAGYRFPPSGRRRAHGYHRERAVGISQLGLPLEHFDVVFGYPWGGRGSRDVGRECTIWPVRCPIVALRLR
jgi:hypothetical protein